MRPWVSSIDTSPAWTFTGGIAYDSSAVDDDNRSVTVPMERSGVFALGAQYAIKTEPDAGAAYEFAWLETCSVDQERGPLAGRVAGDFRSSSFSFFALNLKWTYWRGPENPEDWEYSGTAYFILKVGQWLEPNSWN